MADLRIVHLTDSISRLAGGLFESVRHLSQSVHAVGGTNLSVLALADSRSAEDAPPWDPIPTRVYEVLGPAAFGYAPELLPNLLAQNAALLHVHGLWKYPSMAANHWHRKLRRPYIVSPHGMLEPWALKQSRAKKRIALWLYQGACLRNATCLRATSEMEMERIRAAGFRNPVALIPNGVEMPPAWAVRSSPPAGVGRDGKLYASLRTALFLSRLHPKKGLLNLIEAWSRLSKETAAGSRARGLLTEGWRLVIVGPDEGKHLARVRHAVHLAGLERCVEFHGEAWGDARWQFYRDADLFVLPTYSENFGLVIAEALACRIPVITTRAAPWEHLESHKCGWWIETGVAPLITALRQALATAPLELYAMGERGRDLVTKLYAWEPIGLRMAETYRWMAADGPKPDCVVG